MSTNLIGSSHLHYDELDSTNYTAAQLIAKARPNEGLVISADFQQAGVGQIGSKWLSEPAKNCLFSIILYPTFLKAQHGFVLQMLICTAIRKALAGLSPEWTYKLKWPNDLYCQNLKIGGLLIQSSVRGYYAESAVVGIGLNVNQTDFPKGIGNPGSLCNISGHEWDRSLIMNRIIYELDTAYAAFKKRYPSDKLIQSVISEYEAHLYLKDEWAYFEDVNGVKMELYILGVDTEGNLSVMDRLSKQHTYKFKEISLIK